MDRFLGKILDDRYQMEEIIGSGGMAIVYFVAPFLDNYFRKIKLEIILPICAALMLIFVSDQLYTRKHPNTGEGITCMQDIDEKYMNNIC